MDINKVVIGKPHITKQGACPESVRLQAEIEFWAGEQKARTLDLYYEVDPIYEPFLCDERGDAFLVALLPHMMELATQTREPFVVELDAPVSEQLYYQLKTFYIPSLSASLANRAPVAIHCSTDNSRLSSENKVGAGISGGVDSFYTVLSHQDAPDNHRITHGVFNNFGLYGPMDGPKEQSFARITKDICARCGLDYLRIRSNICTDVYVKAYPPIVTCMFLSAPLALQKLFSVYYYSSSFSFAQFMMDIDNSTHYDLLNVHCLSTQNIDFYSTGSEVTRLEKIVFNDAFDVVHDELRVCLEPNDEADNCGKCAKCSRTMLQLYAIGKLDDYRHVFDVDEFYRDPNYHLGYLLYKKGQKDVFCTEIVEILKRNGTSLPPSAYLAAVGKWLKLHNKNK